MTGTLYKMSQLSFQRDNKLYMYVYICRQNWC